MAATRHQAYPDGDLVRLHLAKFRPALLGQSLGLRGMPGLAPAGDSLDRSAQGARIPLTLLVCSIEQP